MLKPYIERCGKLSMSVSGTSLHSPCTSIAADSVQNKQVNAMGPRDFHHPKEVITYQKNIRTYMDTYMNTNI